jgi:hypothetical protein
LMVSLITLFWGKLQCVINEWMECAWGYLKGLGNIDWSQFMYVPISRLEGQSDTQKQVTWKGPRKAAVEHSNKKNWDFWKIHTFSEPIHTHFFKFGSELSRKFHTFLVCTFRTGGGVKQTTKRGRGQPYTSTHFKGSICWCKQPLWTAHQPLKALVLGFQVRRGGFGEHCGQKFLDSHSLLVTTLPPLLQRKVYKFEVSTFLGENSNVCIWSEHLFWLLIKNSYTAISERVVHLDSRIFFYFILFFYWTGPVRTELLMTAVPPWL